MVNDMPEEKDGHKEETLCKIKKMLVSLPEYVFEGGQLKRICNNRIMNLSNFIPVPLKEILYDDGRSKERYFTVMAVKANGETLPPAKVKASAMASMSWIEDYWGFSAVIEPPIQSKKDYIRHIIFTLGAKYAERRTVYTHTGWRQINGKYIYMYQNGTIGADDVSVELEGNLQAYEMNTAAKFSDGIHAVKDLFHIAPPRIITPLIAITFLSPLNEFFRQGGCEPAFVLYLLGRTQTKKSTVAALMLSFFGRFTSSNLPSSFKDTQNAIEKKGYILKDILTVIDDFHPVSHYRERQSMEQTAQSIARGYGDRAARERMSSDITIRPGYPPRGNAIITGEDFPNIGQSGSARNFIVELNPGDVPNSKSLNAVQEKAWNGCLIAFMRGYIKWLIPQAEDLPEQLRQSFLAYRQKAINNSVCGYGRTGDIVAWLQIGFDFFTDFLKSTGAIEKQESAQMKAKAFHIFCSLAGVQAERAEEDQPTAMFLATLKELLDTGQVCVQKIPSGSFSDCQYTKEKGAQIGYEDETYFYFLPSVTYHEIVKFYAAQHEAFPLTKTRLLRQAAVENLILYDRRTDGNNYTIQKRIGNEKRRFVIMSKAMLFKNS
jgi:hypothetical protein